MYFVLNSVKERKLESFFTFFLFLFVFISDDSVLFGTNRDSLYTTFKYFFVVSSSIVIFFKTVLSGKQIPFHLGIFASLIIITMTSNMDFRFGYFYKIILLLYAWGIAEFLDFNQFTKIFNRVLFFISIFSLIGFCLTLLFQGRLPFLPVVTNVANNDFYNGFLFVIPQYNYANFFRNYGLFREPGVFQIYLSIALLFEFFVLEKKSLVRLIVFSASLIATMSTTGYIAFFLILFLFFVDNQTLSPKKKFSFFALLIISFLYLFFQTSIFSLSEKDLSKSVFAKTKQVDRGTTVARYASVSENIRIFLENPIFGVGLTNVAEKFPEYTKERYGVSTEHNTNCMLIQFSSYGFFYGSFWILGYFFLARKISYKWSPFVFLIFIVVYCGENLSFSGLSNLLFLYGYSSKSRIVYEKNYNCD